MLLMLLTRWIGWLLEAGGRGDTTRNPAFWVAS